MAIDFNNTSQLNFKGFIKVFKSLGLMGVVMAIAGLAIYPLINNKSLNNIKAQVIETRTQFQQPFLSPASYTIVMGKSDREVAIKFDNQNSDLYLKKIGIDDDNCLLNGGRVNCVLQVAYQSKIELVQETNKSTNETKFKQLKFDFLNIKITEDTIDMLIVTIGVILVLLLGKKVSSNK